MGKLISNIKKKILKSKTRENRRKGCYGSISKTNENKVFTTFWDEHRQQPLPGNLILGRDDMYYKLWLAQEV